MDWQTKSTWWGRRSDGNDDDEPVLPEPDSLPEDVPPEVRSLLRRTKINQDLAEGELLRVVPIGKTVTGSGIRVELIALEVRDVGAIIYWKAYPQKPRMLGDIRLRLEDELGTAYEVEPSISGGGGREFKGEVFVTPPPPADAGSFRVIVDGFGEMRIPWPFNDHDEVAGTWDFEFPNDT